MEVWRFPLPIKACSGKTGGGGEETFIAQALINRHIKLKPTQFKWV